MRPERLSPKDPTDNRIRDLPDCSAVPNLPGPPHSKCKCYVFIRLFIYSLFTDAENGSDYMISSDGTVIE